jgi:hypothetical protein
MRTDMTSKTTPLSVTFPAFYFGLFFVYLSITHALQGHGLDAYRMARYLMLANVID